MHATVRRGCRAVGDDYWLVTLRGDAVRRVGTRPERGHGADNCLTVAAIDEAQVPAKEAGVLREMPVRDGQQVAKGDLLAQIDDVEAADGSSTWPRYKLSVAKEEATNDVNVRYAEGRRRRGRGRVLIRPQEANDDVPGTVPQTEVAAGWLDLRADRRWQIEKADWISRSPA